MTLSTFGSLCSGIEAASFVLEPMGLRPLWLSEIADFQCRFLAEKYPHAPNLGDMNDIPRLIEEGKAEIPDLLCGGTPCQAFSLAGWRNGINDDRGQLTLKYIDIIDTIDQKRLGQGKGRGLFFWENVEGALTDKTNAFGCFLAGLIGLSTPIKVSKWPSAGILRGKDRNVAWRVLDAKYFGLPQQRRRIYVLGGGKEFHPESVLFEQGGTMTDPLKTVSTRQPSLFSMEKAAPEISFELTKSVNGHHIEAFRSYSDCLYAAYGTKWNGNAAAYNGSLFFAQDGRLRRLSPLECERLMGFPDNYTLIDKCRDTQRYQAVGNSWPVPVIRWIAGRLISNGEENLPINFPPSLSTRSYQLYLLEDFTYNGEEKYLNASKMPYDFKMGNMVDIADTNTPEKFYITTKGCAGILRRKMEHNASMNERLESVLRHCSCKIAMT